MGAFETGGTQNAARRTQCAQLSPASVPPGRAQSARCSSGVGSRVAAVGGARSTPEPPGGPRRRDDGAETTERGATTEGGEGRPSPSLGHSPSRCSPGGPLPVAPLWGHPATMTTSRIVVVRARWLRGSDRAFPPGRPDPRRPALRTDALALSPGASGYRPGLQPGRFSPGLQPGRAPAAAAAAAAAMF